MMIVVIIVSVNLKQSSYFLTHTELSWMFQPYCFQTYILFCFEVLLVSFISKPAAVLELWHENIKRSS